METMIPFFFSIIGTLGFSMLYRIRLRYLPLAALGGAVSCGALLGMTDWIDNLFLINMVAAMAATLYAEVVARIIHTPVTVLLLPSLFSLAPGGSLYYTMSYLVNGNMELFHDYAVNTLMIALGIAVGIMIISVFMRLIPRRRKKTPSTPQE